MSKAIYVRRANKAMEIGIWVTFKEATPIPGKPIPRADGEYRFAIGKVKNSKILSLELCPPQKLPTTVPHGFLVEKEPKEWMAGIVNELYGKALDKAIGNR